MRRDRVHEVRVGHAEDALLAGVLEADEPLPGVPLGTSSATLARTAASSVAFAARFLADAVIRCDQFCSTFARRSSFRCSVPPFSFFHATG
jgi:hypothetical protein